MRRFLLYLMIASGFVLSSCSSLYEELLVKEESKKMITVTAARITESGGVYTLTLTTAESLETTTAVNINGTPATLAGNLTENTDGTKTFDFDVSGVITATTTGGTIPVTLRAVGFGDTTIYADYTPAVTITPPAARNIFNEDAAFIAEPVPETNYHNSITITKVYTASDGTQLQDWASVKAFMADSANAGKNVTVTYTATADKDSTKNATASTVLTIKSDVTIDTAEISGTVKVGETVTAKTYYLDEDNGNAKTEYQGLNVTYQWYIADSSSGEGSPINGCIEKTYTLKPENAEKYIYVKAVQKNRATGAETEKVSSYSLVAKGDLASGGFTVTYNGGNSVDKGSALDNTKLSVSSLKDANDNPVTPSALKFVDASGNEIAGDVLNASKNVRVKIEADGYEPKTSTVFVTVKAEQPDVELRTDIDNILKGEVAFASAPANTEYSVDGGTTWKTLTSASFTSPANGKILVKTKPSGTAGEDGYLAESDVRVINVASQNIGSKPSAKTVTVTVAAFGDITVTKDDSVAGTVTLTAAEGYTNYEWEVDGSSLPSGFSASTNVLTITTASVAKGTYRVTVSGTKGGIIYSTGISVVVQ